MLTRHSLKSIRRLVSRVLSLRGARYLYHCALTYSPQVVCEQKAKQVLDALLSNLHHCFDMASLHVRHCHENGAIHYHALFFFFEKVPFSPSRMKSEFGSRVFNAWNKLQGGTLVRCANKMTEHGSGLDALRYLLRRVRIAKEPTRAARWWTYRNARLVREKAVPVSRAEHKAAFDSVMPHRPYKRRRGKDYALQIGMKNVSFRASLDALTNFDACEVEPQTFDAALGPFEEASVVLEDPFADDIWAVS